MTLHAAIQKVLLKEKKAMTARNIADALNSNSWYTKKDGSPMKSSQIGARVKNYPDLFDKMDGYISLKSSTGIITKNNINQKKRIPTKSLNTDRTLMMKVLMSEKNFKTISTCEQDIPDQPGLYCIRVKETKAFGEPFPEIFKARKHNIVYIGIASKSLRKRFLGQELRAKGHGTFFRSLGAVLEYEPKHGSLKGKKNQNNYKFSKQAEAEIIKWINKNLIINWVEANSDLNTLENQLIKNYMPLLNIAGNPGSVDKVRLLRNKCKEIARG
jgi:hypothetical protein